MKTSFRSVFPLSGLLVLAVSVFAQAPAPSPGEYSSKVIDLPPLTVTETRELPPPEEWHYAQIEGFEVLSNASPKATNRLLRDFQMFRQALQIVWPVPLKPVVSSSLIFCGAKNKFSDFSPVGKGGAGTGLTSLFFRDHEQTAIVIDLQTTQLSTDDLSIQMSRGLGNTKLQVDPYRQLYREYVRFLLTQTENSPPPWLIEGVSQIVMDMEYTDRWIIYGKIDSLKGAPVSNAIPGAEEEGGNLLVDYEVGDRPFNAALYRRKLLPMGKFFAVSADAPAARNPLGNNLWAKQAYAFVHLCLFRADAKFQKPFNLFLQRLRTEPPSEKLFQECFKMSYKEMLQELHDYLRFTLHKYKTYPLSRDRRLTAKDIDMRDATQAEIARIKGDAQRLAGRRADALATYHAAYARGERDPRLLGALGVEELAASRADRARMFLEAAIKAGTNRPSTYFGLAQLRLDEAKRNPAAADGRLSAKQVATVFDPLIKARALQPACQETYELMAQTWLLSALTPQASNVRVLGEGVLKFPANSKLTYDAAQLHARAGEFTDAAALAQLGLRFAPDAATRNRFEAFLATLPLSTPVPLKSPPAQQSAPNPASNAMGPAK